MAVNVTPLGIATGTGERRLVVVPSPICPKPFHPQQYAAPEAVSAQVCRPPAATFVKMSVAEIGAALERAVRVESPSCPQLLLPQHCATPAAVIPHVCQ